MAVQYPYGASAAAAYPSATYSRGSGMTVGGPVAVPQQSVGMSVNPYAAAPGTTRHESRLMHGHNDMFQAQLGAMHKLAEQMKKLPGGYAYLEHVLSQRSATEQYGEDDPHGRMAKRYRRSWPKDVQIPTPETGCPHGEVYTRNLCRSCYGRYWKMMKAMKAASSSESKSGAPGDFSGDSDFDSEEDGSIGDDGRRRVDKKKTFSEEFADIGANKRPKKAKELCVQCNQRPVLCRHLCNGCYQRWHKDRKVAQQNGLPDVPCPSVAILERRAREAQKFQSAPSLGEGGDGSAKQPAAPEVDDAGAEEGDASAA